MRRDLNNRAGGLRARLVTSLCACVVCVSVSVFALAEKAAAQGALLTASDPQGSGEAEDLEDDEPDAPAPPPLGLCQTDLRLSGTFYNARFPQKSFASFHVRPEHPGGEVYRVGERVGAFAILSVGARTVVLDDGGPGCYLKLAGASVTPPTAPAKPPRKKRREKKPAPAPEPAADSGGFTPEELNEAIRSLGGNKYEIKKDLLPKIAARSAQLRSTTHWQQVRGYSNVLGMRLEKIESNGLFEKLGLQPGDLVKTLNGLQLSSLDGALEAQKLVSSAKNLSLLVQRDGTPITLEYRIVP